MTLAVRGEINKALDFYILSQSDIDMVQKETFTTPTSIIATSIESQTEVNLHNNAPIYTNNNQYDEVEEF